MLMHMKTTLKLTLLLAAVTACLTSSAAVADKSFPGTVRLNQATDISFRNEIQRAIDKGLASLTATQNSNGWWSTPDHPSVSGLALSALLGDPDKRYKKDPRTQKGLDFLLTCAKPDGSIYHTNLINYNTSLSMMALLAANQPKYDPVLRKARAYLAGTQVDMGEPGKTDSPFDGGVGYGSKYAHSDMNNTLVAIEAMYYSRHLAEDKNLPETKDLNWQAVATFIQNCQNLPSHNKQDWVSNDPKHQGGFIYYPGTSMAGSETNAAGKVALRSYGSISYGGLLSYIYADVKKTDPRVVAVLEWLRANYTLEENPGMGPQGYYYYLHLMTKALNAYGAEILELKDGKKINWRKDVAMRLINLQKADGSWTNDNGRWWEKDPAIVTAYAVMSLEIIYRGM